MADTGESQKGVTNELNIDINKTKIGGIEMNTNNDLNVIMRNAGVNLLNKIQMGISYAPNWDKELSYKEILSSYNQILGAFAEIIGDEDITKQSKEELTKLGFKKWDEDMPDLLLIPLWFYNLIPDGIELTSINGDKAIKGKDEIDLDVRFGCIAYGIEVK